MNPSEIENWKTQINFTLDHFTTRPYDVVELQSFTEIPSELVGYLKKVCADKFEFSVNKNIIRIKLKEE